MSIEEIANEYLKTKNSSWDYYVDTTEDFKDISLEKIDSFMQKIERNLNMKHIQTANYIIVATPTNYDEVTNYFDTSLVEIVI